MSEQTVLTEKQPDGAGQSRAIGLFLLKQYKAAETVYDELLKKDPDNIVFWVNRMICRLQYLPAGTDFFDQMIKRVNDLPSQGYLCLADVLYTLCHVREALVFVNKALEKDAENVAAYVLKASLLNELERFDDLPSLFRSVYPAFKREERILCLMAAHAVSIGKTRQAKRFLKKSLKLNRFETLQNRSFYQTLLAMGKNDRVLTFGAEALNVREDNPFVWSAMIQAYLALEDDKRAEASFQVLSGLRDLSEEERFRWIDALIRLKDYDKAFNLLIEMPYRSETWLFCLQTLFDALQQDGLNKKCRTKAKFLINQTGCTPEVQYFCDIVLHNEKRTEKIPLSVIRLMNDKNAADLMLSTSDSSYALSFLLEEMLGFLEKSVGSSLDVLDLGCGTGAMAPVLENYSRPSGSLTGVDISPVVLALASDQEKYSDLQEEDLLSFCKDKAHAKQYDLIVCMDVLFCFSSLIPVFKAVKSALKPGGSFIFSVLPLEETEQGFLFENGMFYHSADYVFSCLKSARLQAEYQQEGFLYKGEKGPCTVFAVRKRK